MCVYHKVFFFFFLIQVAILNKFVSVSKAKKQANQNTVSVASIQIYHTSAWPLPNFKLFFRVSWHAKISNFQQKEIRTIITIFFFLSSFWILIFFLNGAVDQYESRIFQATDFYTKLNYNFFKKFKLIKNELSFFFYIFLR